MNGEIITKYDIMRVSGKRNIDDIIFNKTDLDNKPKRFTNTELHDKSIKSYKKRLDRMYKDDMVLKPKSSAIDNDRDVYGGLE